jgi:hypothetical protein
MGKHHPFTTEPSNPHEGSIGQKHVDYYHYGEGGKEVGRTSHITNPGAIRYGEIAKEYRERQKEKGGK